MKLSLLLAAPAVVALVGAGVVLFNSPPRSLGEPEQQSLSAPPSLDSPTATAEASSSGLPNGLTGRLTIRSGDELITLQAPDMDEIARRADDTREGEVASSTGWKAAPNCHEYTCEIIVLEPGGRNITLRVPGLVTDLAWRPKGTMLAYSVWYFEGERIARGELLLSDLAAPPRSVYEQSRPGVLPFSWTNGGDLIVAVNANGRATLRRVLPEATAGDLATTNAGVSYIYPSPDGSRVAFTQNGAGGWRLSVFDAATGEVRDLGPMGSDAPGAPPAVSPEQKGPMYVAWSLESSMLAFGGGYEAPYFMTVVDVRSGAKTITQFPYGYPGEIAWSPDGSIVAVSTYDPDRTRHEVYVVDPLNGASRHLIAGCVIVWSPDGRFLALHAEKADGVAVIDVATRQQGSVGETGDVPVSWTE